MVALGASAGTAIEHPTEAPEPFDIALLDLRLLDGKGTDLLSLLAERHAGAVVAVVSGYLDAEEVVRLAATRVLAVPKPISCATLARLAEELALRRTGRTSRIDAFAARYALSPTETEVLRLSVEDLSVEQIAERLDCSVKTVGTHRSRIYAKSGLHSMVSVLAAIARMA